MKIVYITAFWAAASATAFLAIAPSLAFLAAAKTRSQEAVFLAVAA